MPRNIEYLLEQYLEDSNLPQFILTCAIDFGFYPPEYILKKHGGGYGFDNFILSHKELLSLKMSLEENLKELKLVEFVDEKTILAEIEKNYARENQEYCRLLNCCSQEIDKVDNMSIRVNRLVASNEAQKIFLTTIGSFFDLKRKEINERYEKILKEPTMETFEQARLRLFDYKIIELEDSIKSLEIKLLFDENFFIEISKDWLK